MIFEKIIGIVACDPQGVMGKEGKLSWDYPEDWKYFSKAIQKVSISMEEDLYVPLLKGAHWIFKQHFNSR